MPDKDRGGERVVSRKRYRQAGSLLDQTKGLLRRFGLRARKGLGQHFLIDEEVLKRIISAAELTPGDIILEIGPGLGVLTRELAGQVGRVVAIELDNTLAAILNQTLVSFNNVTILNEDVLSVDPAALLEELQPKSPLKVEGASGYKVVANLPYYITSPVLRRFLEASVKPQMMVVMVQKEVAEEIAAKPGKMSLLSIGVQLYGEPTIIDYVPARCFYPVPRVDSAILRVIPYAQPALEVDNEESFFTLVRAGFSTARKQLVNSLARGLGLSRDESLSLLEEAGIVAQRRAEALTLEEWAYLWRVFARREESAC